ncbi:NDP-sugar synthase [Cohnella hashimotonis]|uniref:NDP-sugar synthase n=1 Tax=Cohnella hashimotonis TaxID=2826895 RepID=A0ABT6TLJ7_9BACL|nr:NDP-sugar synthase [Cohnella hashimotonis]MDI4647594.1 NDP-sugar synthase [Cohnella hashimotonis]
MQALLLGSDPAAGLPGGWTLPIANRPWIEHWIAQGREQGIVDLVVAVGMQDEMDIRSLLGDGTRYGMRIAYLTGSEPLGTAGTIKLAEPLLQERFIVLHADAVHAFRLDDLMAYHAERAAAATICLTPGGRYSPHGVVTVDSESEVLSLVPGPSPHNAPSNLNNSGVYMMSKSALSLIPEGRYVSLENETFPLLIGNGSKISGYIPDTYCMLTTTPESYVQLHWDLLDRRLPLSISGTEMNERGIWIGKGAIIGKGVLLVPPVVIGDYARIGDKAIVGPYTVIGPYCTVGQGARISRTIVPARSAVNDSSRLSERVFGSGATVAEASL